MHLLLSISALCLSTLLSALTLRSMLYSPRHSLLSHARSRSRCGRSYTTTLSSSAGWRPSFRPYVSDVVQSSRGDGSSCDSGASTQAAAPHAAGDSNVTCWGPVFRPTTPYLQEYHGCATSECISLVDPAIAFAGKVMPPPMPPRASAGLPRVLCICICSAPHALLQMCCPHALLRLGLLLCYSCCCYLVDYLGVAEPC